MLKILLVGLIFLEGFLSLNIHKGIHIRDPRNAVDLLQVDLYLRRYGYLVDHMPETQILASEKDRKEALQFFQNFNKIPITGELDSATQTLMAKERCGCPDVMPQKNEASISQKKNPPTPVQFNLGTRWTNNKVSWRLNSVSPSSKISRAITERETRRAFDIWAKSANLQFEERRSGDADIVIDFASGNHGDGAGNAFDGRGRVLAHAFFPPFGDTHFDDDEDWVVNRTGTDYFIVAAHEFGHALGLSHSEVRTALMAPFYAGYVPDYQLDRDDIAGIQALYGPPTTAPRPTPAPMTPVPPTVTQAPPQPPPSNRPLFCTVSFNAIVKDFNGDYLAFIGRAYMFRINSNGLVSVTSQRATFRGSPLRPDAAFEVYSGSEIMMLKGQLLYGFDRSRGRVRRVWVSGGEVTMPERPRAAIAFSSFRVFVFGYSMLWQMSPNTGQVIANTHRYIRDEYPGIPNGIDAAVLKDDNTILFFRGETMYTFRIDQRRVTSQEDKGKALMPNNCATS